MPRQKSRMAVASVGTTLRAITRPVSSRTAATVVAWCTSRPTYLGVRFMSAAPCCGPWEFDNSMVAARGVLSISVRATTRMSKQSFSQFIAAPPRAVYRTLLDPRLIERWRVPTGMHAEVHEFDARTGGRFRVSLTYEAPGRTGKR